MQTRNEPFSLESNGWVVKVQRPAQPQASSRVLLLVHGWTGDESSMWIFTNKLSPDTWLFAPRGPVTAQPGGFGWLYHRRPGQEDWPDLPTFGEVAGELMQAFQGWREEAGAPLHEFDVMGFSQGAAMAYTLGAYYPQQVRRVVALAGKLPDEAPGENRYQAYQGKQVYVAHGTADETVSVQFAQQAVRALQAEGAQVTYCESDVGHKLSASCLRGLEAFLAG